jgi:hypothetical protein
MTISPTVAVCAVAKICDKTYIVPSEFKTTLTFPYGKLKTFHKDLIEVP